MGTEICLRLNNLTVNYGKNRGYADHGDLFQASDLVSQILASEDGGEPEVGHFLRQPFTKTLYRLDLLGVSLASVRAEFAKRADEEPYFDSHDDENFHTIGPARNLEFEKFANLIAKLDLDIFGDEYLYRPDGWTQYFRTTLDSNSGYSNEELENAGELFQTLSAQSTLWLLGQNEKNVVFDLTWDFSEHVLNGWSVITEHVRPLTRARRFLIVTEGSSDAAIIEKALRIRRADIADFFYFVDTAKQGFPFTGTGSLHNFCKGLATINVLNKTLILYDNDAVGVETFQESAKLTLPPNISVAHLPDLPGLKFDTIGPDGASVAEISGRAASIETFLDLSHEPNPTIRWGNYVDRIDAYQGVLLHKEKYMKHFLNCRTFAATYDWSKLDKLVAIIVSKCIDLARSVT